MKYMMLTYADAEVYDLDAFTEGKREWIRDMVAFMHRLNADLTASGELVSAEGLAGPTETKTVRPQGDAAITTDGPYAEAKEFLAGFWIIDVADFDRAAEIAGKIVRYVNVPIELRPIGEAPQV